MSVAKDKYIFQRGLDQSTIMNESHWTWFRYEIYGLQTIISLGPGGWS